MSQNSCGIARFPCDRWWLCGDLLSSSLFGTADSTGPENAGPGQWRTKSERMSTSEIQSRSRTATEVGAHIHFNKLYCDKLCNNRSQPSAIIEVSCGIYGSHSVLPDVELNEIIGLKQWRNESKWISLAVSPISSTRYWCIHAFRCITELFLARNVLPESWRSIDQSDWMIDGCLTWWVHTLSAVTYVYSSTESAACQRPQPGHAAVCSLQIDNRTRPQLGVGLRGRV